MHAQRQVGGSRQAKEEVSWWYERQSEAKSQVQMTRRRKAVKLSVEELKRDEPGMGLDGGSGKGVGR